MNREIIFRARFKYAKTGMIIWQMSCPNHIIKDSIDLEQISEWEQYIGQSDKNGEQLFENDLIINPSRNGGKPHIIALYQGTYCGNYNALSYPLWHEQQEVEKVGNIHEGQT